MMLSPSFWRGSMSIDPETRARTCRALPLKLNLVENRIGLHKFELQDAAQQFPQQPLNTRR
jgi:hypothetical protein